MGWGGGMSVLTNVNSCHLISQMVMSNISVEQLITRFMLIKLLDG